MRRGSTPALRVWAWRGNIGSVSRSQNAYVISGNAVAPVEDRGTVLLVVEQTQLDTTRDGVTTLAPELRRFEADLIGDGYKVVTTPATRADVPRDLPSVLADPNVDTNDPAVRAKIDQVFEPYKPVVTAVKQSIRAAWQRDSDLRHVFLIGHVPVPYSGRFADDGHPDHGGAWPSDAFYSTPGTPDTFWEQRDTRREVSYQDVNGQIKSVSAANKNFPGDGKFDIDSLSGLTYQGQPVFADVAVSRLDTAMLSPFPGAPADAGSVASVAETNLLKSYLDKDHRWRQGELTVKRQALVDEAYSFDGYFDEARFTPNVGRSNIIDGHVSAKRSKRNAGLGYDHELNNDSWLWVYAGGSGARTSGEDYIHNYGQLNATDPSRRDFYASYY